MNKRVKAAKVFAKLLDSQFSVFGIRFGLDPIINLIPYGGAILGGALSLYILKTSYDLGVSKRDFAMMIFNVILDVLVGVVPYIGIIFDIVYKANVRNVKILEKYSHGKFVEGEIVS